MGDVEVVVRRVGVRAVPLLGAALYPDPGQDWERWAEQLTPYDGGGLARASAAHEEELRATGWRETRLSSEESLWDPPLAKRQRRSVGQVGEVLVKLVRALDPLRMPRHVPRPVVKAALGIVEALGCLLFYPTTDEALRSRFGLPRPRRPPTQARFRRAAQVLAIAGSPKTQCLGMGSPSYRIAESRGRTRARWDEVECRATHVSNGGIPGLHDVETGVDAAKALARTGLDEIDLAGLRDWLDEGVQREERVRRYRMRLTGQPALLEDEAANRRARVVTADLTDRAILERLTRARATLDGHLAKLPAKGEALAVETGDLTFLAPLVAARVDREKEPRPKRDRCQVERIGLGAPRCL